MKLSRNVKPISFLKAHASEIIKTGLVERGPIVITHNGEAKAVIQDIAEYERTQETLAMLKLLAQSQKSFQEGRAKPVAEAFKEIRRRVATSSL